MKGSKYCIFLFVCTLYIAVRSDCSSQGKRARRYACQTIKVAPMKKLAGMSDMKEFKKLLDPIMKERVSGSEGNKQVQKYLISKMQDSYKWEVEIDLFVDEAPQPHGKIEFTNIIARLNPDALHSFVLACHFDSKYYKDEHFIGATDSAVPCAMMLDLARTMNSTLHKWAASNPKAAEIGLEFIFFDGEEAFQKWTATDSIYGARHLASKWDATTKNGQTLLERINVFLLLDLIGTKTTQFRNWFDDTQHLFERFANIEGRLKDENLLDLKDREDGNYFNKVKMWGKIEDDHVPFLNKQVPILHFISFPFPDEWHKPTDDETALHYPTIDNINKILRIFVAEYLHLYKKGGA